MTGREYSQRLWLYFEDMINLQVTHSIYYPRDFRGTRDSGPEPYDGTRDIDKFEKWLVQLLKFYQTNKMCGRRTDFLRVIHSGKHLSGKASDWYETNVYSVERDPSIRWTFIEVICRLFLEFIDENALQLAVHSYYRVRYAEPKGVDSYIHELKKKANRLTSKPDEFTFRERFIEGLPDNLIDRMIDKYDITAESSIIDQMTTAIKKIEKSSIYRKRVRERRRAHRPSRSPSPDYRDRKGEKSRTEEPRRRSLSREQRRSRRKERRGEKRERYHSNRDDVRRERKFELTKDRARGDEKGKGLSPNVTCFACQQKGHYANDPACPMYSKRDKPTLRDRPQVRAARAGREQDWSSGGETVTYRDGSQYSPSTSGDSLKSELESNTSTTGASSDESDDSEIRPHLNKMDTVDPGEGEDVKYIRAVRAKVTPAIEEHPAQSSLSQKLDRPMRSKRQETCLAGWIRVNGVDALTLFDSGSNTDTLSPAFTQVSGIQTRKLEQQVPLQLGTVGSRAAINYGAEVPIEVGDTKYPKYYFNIVNINRYDCIAGAPMMRKFRVRLDFREDAIYVGDERIPALLTGGEGSFTQWVHCGYIVSSG